MALPARIIERDRVYSAEEFMALPLDPDKRYELVRGIVKEMSHPGGEHMFITDNLYGELRNHVRANRLGRVLPPGGYELKIPGAEKDSVRSPDLTFIPAAQVNQIGSGAITFPPALAVEVYSPNDRPGELAEKLADYPAAGWNLVWVIYPATAPSRKRLQVEVYHLQQSVRPTLLGQNEELIGEDVIPGFKIKVSELFNYTD